MQKKHLKKAAVVLALALAGCGGGGGTNSETASTPQAPLTCPAGQYLDLSTGTCVATSTVKASTYAGNWDGTYTLSGSTDSTPIALKLSAQDSTKTVSGQVYSRYLAATVQGVVADDGTVTLSGTNTVDGKQWSVALRNTPAGMIISTIRDLAGATTGSGSCAAAATVAFDLVGEYPVTITQSFPGSDSTVLNARMSLARVNPYSYTGVIVGDGGLQAKINFFRLGSSWAVQIPSGETLGTSMFEVTNGLLTQSLPITDAVLTAAMTDGVKTPVLSPLVASLSGNYLMTVGGRQIEQFCDGKRVSFSKMIFSGEFDGEEGFTVHIGAEFMKAYQDGHITRQTFSDLFSSQP